MKILRKNNNKWFSTEELSNIIGTGTGSLSINCSKLFMQGLVTKKLFFKPQQYLKYKIK